MENKDRPVVFLHIPKTAGLTFHEILKNQYPDRKRHLIHQVVRTKKYIDFSYRKKKSIGLIMGHFLYGIHQFMPVSPIYLTMLRNPVARTMSGYDYIVNNKWHPFHKELMDKKYSLADFLIQKKVSNFDNMQVRFLCGDNSMPFGDVNDSHLELAKKNLVNEDMFFGITEMFDESMLYFKHELGWSLNPFYVKMNISPASNVNRNELDQKTMDAILNCNKYDLQLYEFAKASFENKIKCLGEEFKTELEQFVAKNATYETKEINYFKRIINRLTQG